jgi:uncharacterized protein (DUF2267 family)
MHQLIQQVADRAGISEDSATRAVETVMNFLRDKLPGPLASQVENYLGGEGEASEAGAGESMMARAGSMLGGSKTE